MLLISETYEIVSHESAENGEAEDTGFICDCEEISFRDLVRKMRDFPQASSSGPVNRHTWFTSYPDQDFRTGDEESRSIHFHRDNAPHLEKYWIKAAKAAGIK